MAGERADPTEPQRGKKTKRHSCQLTTEIVQLNRSFENTSARRPNDRIGNDHCGG
jgi:hypothetical protein